MEEIEPVDADSLVIQVGRWLVAKGFNVGHGGVALPGPESLKDGLGCITIIYEPPNFPRRSRLCQIFRKLKAILPVPRRFKRIVLGTLRLENEWAETDGFNWIFDTYGRQYLQIAETLAEEIARAFKANIDVYLVKDRPELERFSGDGDIY